MLLHKSVLPTDWTVVAAYTVEFALARHCTVRHLLLECSMPTSSASSLSTSFTMAVHMPA